MLKKLQEIIGEYGTVKRCYDVDTTISKAYYFEYIPIYGNMSLEYQTYWKITIKDTFPNRNVDYYHHYGTNTATMWVLNNIKEDRKEDRKEKLENLKNIIR